MYILSDTSKKNQHAEAIISKRILVEVKFLYT